ncbi:Trypsin [uncultured Eubacteriales bacterium]|uniref:Trypsin n=1 Tax=uncultured Eubacteriales bacterium TaxID=172733 RepID=A0A212IYN4_9FIRM|nr:Trypsin [uncultured Eubacteriales bacterium]
MHHTNYYDTYPGFVPPAPPPTPAPLPPSLRERKAAHRAEKAALRAGRRGRGRHWTAPVVFILFLMLIGGTAAVLLAVNYSGSSLQFRPFDPTSPSYENPYGDFNFDLDTEETPTTIKRAPTVSGVTVDLRAALGEELTLQDIYQKCIPSIVSILTTSSQGSSSGTGVVLTEDGYIITNYHVIQGGSSVDVVLHSGKSYSALLVGGDQTNDLAILKIKADDLTPAEFGDSDALQVGDGAVAIGNPLGEELRGTMTDGIISAIDRDVRSDGNTMTLIQTSAALNSGNSGGALINMHGQVVGITNMKMMSDYNTIEGLGFAIPSTTVKAVAEELLSTGYISGRPTLGFTGYSLAPAEARRQGLVPGVYVSSVEEKSDAWTQGLRSGDVVTECNGQAVSSVEDVNAIKANFQAGDTLSFQVYRDSEYLEMDILLVERYELDR